MIALAALGYKLVNHGKATNIGAASATRTVPVPPPTAPAAVVRAYFAAINHHNYGLAWRLGGKNTGRSKAEFVSGFAGTAHDSVRILGQSGDSVRAQGDRTADQWHPEVLSGDLPGRRRRDRALPHPPGAPLISLLARRAAKGSGQERELLASLRSS